MFGNMNRLDHNSENVDLHMKSAATATVTTAAVVDLQNGQIPKCSPFSQTEVNRSETGR